MGPDFSTESPHCNGCAIQKGIIENVLACFLTINNNKKSLFWLEIVQEWMG